MHPNADHGHGIERQYALRDRAIALGWSTRDVVVVDQDIGCAATGARRDGFDHLLAEVGAGCVGIVLGFDASRLARNERDWQRLVDVCARTDTLIGRADTLDDLQARRLEALPS
jgi:DNA invertase Pin-like site-specific DNA recombinase